ncbi:MAG: aminopeptidase N C-terminal domain-containing protein, partial [Xanthomonadales bacterium]|nr:aminopeptidase N C-terminal domain-containing protein [Xanthomonadales bacterium]
LDYPYSSSELAVLMAHDSDDFVRWEAAQLLSQREILANVRRLVAGGEPRLAAELVTAYQALLADTGSDPALVSEALALPAEDYLAELVEIVEVDAIHAARKFVKASLAERLKGAFLDRYQSMAMAGPYSKTPEAMARRSLRNVCLSFLLEAPGGFELAQAQLQTSNNMTDTLAALQGLVWSGAPAADAALQEFHDQWSDDLLVMDKWFAIQAAMPGGRAVGRVRELLDHPGFSISNPNKVRSLIGVFAMMNPTGFHTIDGAGYRLHADQVLALDAINPQMAARMAGAFNAWTRYDESRQRLMQTELKRIAEVESLSPDVAEIINNALGMKKSEPEA